MYKKEIIPTLLALDKKAFAEKLNKLKFAKKIHLDFMDGIFTEKSSVSINEMEEIQNFKDIEFEVHMMAYEPEQYVGKIKRFGIKKVLIHYEAFETDSELRYSMNVFRERGIKVFLVINPVTEIEDVLPYLEDIDGVMFMSVWPGKEAQQFISNTFNRIKELKSQNSNIIVQVDGGIKDVNCKQIIDSGADILSVGSFISNSENPEKNYEILFKILK